MTSEADAAILHAVRRHLIASLCIIGCACSPAAPAQILAPAVVQTPAAASAPASASAPAVEQVMTERRPAFMVSIDGPQADRYSVSLLGALDPSLRQMAEREFGLKPGTLSQPSLLAQLGIDPMRPMLFGLAALNERARALVDEGRRETTGSSQARARIVSKVVRELDGTEMHLGFLVPAVDPEQMLGLLEGLLGRARWEKASDPQGFQAVWTHRDDLLAITTSADSVAIDYTHSGEHGTGGISSLLGRSAALRGSLRALAPPLEGNAARMTLYPSLVAEVGFLQALATVQRAVRSMDEEYRERIVNQGLQEAGRILELSAASGAGYFETAEIALQTGSLFPGLTGVAIAGPGTVPPAAGACAPSVSLDFPDPDVAFDVSNACVRSFKLPGDSDSGALERSRFQDWVRDGGAWGAFVSLPFLPSGVAREGLSHVQGVSSGALSRFERFGRTGQVPMARNAVFWGLLPSGAGPKDAACALTEQGAPCSGKDVLTPGKIREVGRSWARVIQVGNRWLVLVATEKSAIEKLSPSLTKAPVPAMRAVLAGRAFRREFPSSMLAVPLEAWHWQASSTWEGNSLRVAIQPVQQKP